MDYHPHDEIHDSYVAFPAPEPRFRFRRAGGPVLFFSEYPQVLAFYIEVLGEPGYAEGTGTRGWIIGESYLTLLRGGDGAPRNTEIGLVMATPEEAERLQAAFIAAGGSGDDPSDQLMYEPVRFCPVTDPFGTSLLIYAPLGDQSGLA
ncbi:MAG: hypothetical protein ABIJ75_04065 [Actinomycetota bacterium]